MLRKFIPKSIKATAFTSMYHKHSIEEGMNYELSHWSCCSQKEYAHIFVQYMYNILYSYVYMCMHASLTFMGRDFGRRWRCIIFHTRLVPWSYKCVQESTTGYLPLG